MWDWVLILSLICTGLLLVVVEILFVPGTTIVGLFGFAFLITAVFSAYHVLGPQMGHYVLTGSLLTFGLSIYLAFRSEIWLRFANKRIIESKVNEGLLDGLEEGLEGIAISDLKPIGKAVVLERIYEVTSSTGNLIVAGKMIKIVKIKDSRIFVELLNKI